MRLPARHPLSLKKAVSLIRKGGVVAIPTETFYGLSVDPFSREAVTRLYRMKERPSSKPVLLLIGDRGMLRELVASVPKLAERLMERFWPGPLTIVFEAKRGLPPWITAGTDTIALRLSPHPVPTRLSLELGGPITGTSANTSGMPPAKTPEEVLSYFPKIDAVLDDGPTRGSKPSTLVSVVGGTLKVLREGAVSKDLLEEF